MKVCGCCDCMVRRHELSCPFCDVVLRDVPAPAVFGLAAALAACGPRVIIGEDDGDRGSTSVTSDGTNPTTAGPPMPPPATESTSGVVPVTGTSSTSGSSEVTDYTAFIEDPDGGALYGLECTPWDQDCPKGSKCSPWANDGGTHWNATRCSPLAEDPSGPGEPCTVEDSPWSGVDDCDITSMCFHVDPASLAGVCVAFCTGSENDPMCSSAAQACTMTHEGVLILCLDRCDPLGEGCPDPRSCTVVDGTFVCTTPGDVELGAECEQWFDCATGLSCAVAASADCDTACCTESCDPARPACSDASQTCAPVDPAGLCTAP